MGRGVVGGKADELDSYDDGSDKLLIRISVV